MEQKKFNIDEAGTISRLAHILKEYIITKKKYKIFFRGKSFDFETFRDYSYAEDALNIDWIASARFDKLLIRQYKEEEKLTVIFLIDASENMILGSGEKLKCECAAELALALSYVILNTDCRVGFVFFNDDVCLFYPPQRGKRCLSSFSEALSTPKNYGGGSNLGRALDFLLTLPGYISGSLVIISDFTRLDKIAKEKLPLVSFRYETIAFMIRDLIDEKLPDISGEFVIEDPSSREQLLFNPRLANKSYEKNIREQKAFVEECLKRSGIDFFELKTNEPFVDKVVAFVKGRVYKIGGRTWK
jgi:uncharacterized protein (DUF58 family)